MRGLILDGVTAVGKTSVLKHLHDLIDQRHSGTTRLYISEHYTQRVLEDRMERQNLSPTQLAGHASGIIKQLEYFHRQLAVSKFIQNPTGADAYVTVERFLLTYFTADRALLDGYTLRRASSHFRRLARCNIAQIVLVLSDDQLEQNIRSTLVHRNEVWLHYIDRLGGIEAAISSLQASQKRLRELSNMFKRVIPTTELSVDNRSYTQVAQEIYDRIYQQP